LYNYNIFGDFIQRFCRKMSSYNRNVLIPHAAQESGRLFLVYVSPRFSLRSGFPFHRILRLPSSLTRTAEQNLVGFEYLKQAALEPDHIIIGHRPFVFKTHDFPEIRLTRRHAGIRRVCRRTGELLVCLGKTGFLKKPVRRLFACGLSVGITSTPGLSQAFSKWLFGPVTPRNNSPSEGSLTGAKAFL
jgi:hypothetical protein